MPDTIILKRGTSLDLTMQFSEGGVPFDVSGWTLSSQVRDVTGDLVANLPMTLPGPTGLVTISVPDTSAWPMGMLRCDIKMVDGSKTQYSDTFGIDVRKSVTQS